MSETSRTNEELLEALIETAQDATEGHEAVFAEDLIRAFDAVLSRMTGGWQDMSSAPKDGTPILVTRDNGCGWDHYVVWWRGKDTDYPWECECNSYPFERMEYWMPLPAPPSLKEGEQP